MCAGFDERLYRLSSLGRDLMADITPLQLVNLVQYPTTVYSLAFQFDKMRDYVSDPLKLPQRSKLHV